MGHVPCHQWDSRCFPCSGCDCAQSTVFSGVIYLTADGAWGDWRICLGCNVGNVQRGAGPVLPKYLIVSDPPSAPKLLGFADHKVHVGQHVSDPPWVGHCDDSDVGGEGCDPGSLLLLFRERLRGFCVRGVPRAARLEQYCQGAGPSSPQIPTLGSCAPVCLGLEES